MRREIFAEAQPAPQPQRGGAPVGRMHELPEMELAAIVLAMLYPKPRHIASDSKVVLDIARGNLWDGIVASLNWSEVWIVPKRV